MSETVRVNLKQAILVGYGEGADYAKVLIGEHRMTADVRLGAVVFHNYTITGFLRGYRGHIRVFNLAHPATMKLAETNILSVDELQGDAGYVEANAHEFLARQLFAVPAGTPVSPRQYDDAKTISYGLTYNMTETDLARQLNRSTGQTAELLDRYLSFLCVDRATPRQVRQIPTQRCAKAWTHSAHDWHNMRHGSMRCPGRVIY